MNLRQTVCVLLHLAIMTGTAFAAGGVRVVRTPGDGAVPDAEIGLDGTVHVAYVAGDDVYYTRSTNEGSTFLPSLRVNSQPGTAHPPGMFRGPDLALGESDTVHVIWYANAYQRKRPKEEWGVYYSRLPRTADAFAPAANLNHRPSDNYSIAADTRGRVAVFWMAEGLYLNESKDNGVTFAAIEKVMPADSCECCASRAFIGSDGALFCAYRDKAGNQRDMYLLTKRLQATEWTTTKASGTPWMINGCPMTGTYLARAGEGVAMAWETKGIVSFARFDANGRMTGKEITVPGDGGKYPVVLVGLDGVACVSWKKSSALHWQLFAADGRALGESASQPTPNGHRHAGVVTKRGEFLLID